MEPTETEVVIRLYGVSPAERDQLRNHLVQQSKYQSVPLGAEASSDVLGDVSYETILVVCAAIQTAAEVVKTIHALLEPWLEEQRRKRQEEGQESPVTAEIVIDGEVVKLGKTTSNKGAT